MQSLYLPVEKTFKILPNLFVRNEQYCGKPMPERFHLNGNPMGFRSEISELRVGNDLAITLSRRVWVKIRSWNFSGDFKTQLKIIKFIGHEKSLPNS